MKTSQRIPKAIAVIVIVGIGFVYQMDKRHIIADGFQQISTEFGNKSIESDSIDNNTANTEDKLLIYTKSIIETSIHHLIPNI